jgi:peptidyl-prolyl cis-trans isomerase D
MMLAAQDGKSFSDAATLAGVTPKLSPLVTRTQQGADIPPILQNVMFGLKKGEATMVETPEGFVVAQLTEIVKPDAVAEKADYERTRAGIAKSISNDVASVFIDAVRLRAEPRTNQRAFDSVVQP